MKKEDESIDTIIKEIKQDLTKLVDDKQYSMLQISKETGISYQSIRKIILTDDANPTAKTIRILSKYIKDQK